MFELPEEGRQGSVQQGRQGMKIKPHNNSLTAHDSTQQQMQQQQAGACLPDPSTTMVRTFCLPRCATHWAMPSSRRMSSSDSRTPVAYAARSSMLQKGGRVRRRR